MFTGNSFQSALGITTNRTNCFDTFSFLFTKNIYLNLKFSKKAILLFSMLTRRNAFVVLLLPSAFVACSDCGVIVDGGMDKGVSGDVVVNRSLFVGGSLQEKGANILELTPSHNFLHEPFHLRL